MAKSLHRFGKFCAIISFNKLFDFFSFFSLWDSNNSHIFFLWYPKKHTGFSLSLFVLLWLDNFKVSALHFKDSFFWLIHSAVDGFTSFIVFFSFRISVYYDFCVFVNFSFLFLYCFYWFCSIILLFPLSFLEIAIWNSFFFFALIAELHVFRVDYWKIVMSLWWFYFSLNFQDTSILVWQLSPPVFTDGLQEKNIFCQLF